jgi:sensor histidine kinase YesM
MQMRWWCWVQLTTGFQKQLAEAETKALRAQMNPHFIFNSLNSINSFVMEQKHEIASDYLIKFSKLIRLILDNSRSETISLEKELETLKYTLFLKQPGLITGSNVFITLLKM